MAILHVDYLCVNQVQTDKFETTQENINDQQVQLNKNGKHYNNDDDVCEDQKNKNCHLSSETPTIGLTRAIIKKLLSIDSVPSEDEISLYITNDFFKDIFFTQLAIIKQEELFETPTIINPLKKFLKEAFLLHLKYELTRSNNPNMDNYYTL
ncbi:hypothetical protein C1646_662412 [Rhizophagus diaphanus]|nr:hypothetical protein C1646_662412 [Rhizophagus diaphanus] [Rhizophagus sp. MUCL 43196]